LIWQWKAFVVLKQFVPTRLYCCRSLRIRIIGKRDLKTIRWKMHLNTKNLCVTWIYKKQVLLLSLHAHWFQPIHFVQKQCLEINMGWWLMFPSSLSTKLIRNGWGRWMKHINDKGNTLVKLSLGNGAIGSLSLWLTLQEWTLELFTNHTI
jgi:hypothetical protein